MIFVPNETRKVKAIQTTFARLNLRDKISHKGTKQSHQGTKKYLITLCAFVALLCAFV